MGQKIDDDNIPDATDFLNTSQPQLVNLDKGLRCEICKDYFQDPMMTSCSHTFCSLCIRTTLANDGKCPTCRQGDQASKLRKNWVLREVVGSWTTARQAILQAVSANIQDATRPNGDEADVRDKGCAGKKRDIAHVEQAEEAPRYRTRSKRYPGSPPEANPVSSSRSASASPSVSALRHDEDQHPPRSPATQHDQAQPTSDDASNIVACPLCHGKMRNDLVFSHLDSCDGTQASLQTRFRTRSAASQTLRGEPLSTTPALSAKPPPQPPTHLAFLNYSMLNEAALRKKLSDLGLPAHGKKPLLQRRHSHWVNLFNANCDAQYPKSTTQLLRHLDAWERTIGGVRLGNLNPANANHAIMGKDFDRQAYSCSHQDQFHDLIAKARKSAAAPASTAPSAPPIPFAPSHSPSPCPSPSSLAPAPASTPSTAD